MLGIDKTKDMIKCTGFLFLVMIVWFVPAKAQNQAAIAPFKIRLVNGEGYTYKQLSKNKETVLIYFDPACDKCKAFAAALMRHTSVLKNRQVVMISYEDIRAVINFDNTFHLSSQPDIKIGSEGYTFVVQKYYSIEHFPFVAIYNKNGTLLKMIRNEEPPQKLIEALTTAK